MIAPRSRLAALPYAEIATALSATVGFFLVVWAAAALLTPMMWALGTGLYLLSLSGFGLLWTVARDGLYSLTRDED